jgi:hypothetical protein
MQNTILAFNNTISEDVLLERVLWISPDKSEVVLMNIKDKTKLNFPYYRSYQEIIELIEVGQVRTLNIEPDLRLLAPDEEYLNTFIKDRDEKWEIIKDVALKEPEIFLRKFRGTLVKEAASKAGKPEKTIYEWLKKYWFYGKTKNGLLKNYLDCGVPGNDRKYERKPGPKSEDGNLYIVTEKDKKIFKDAIKKFHKTKGLNIKETYKHMLQEYYQDGYYRKHGVMVPIVSPENCPTERQFRYWYDKEYGSKQKYGAKYGKHKAEMNARALIGTPSEDVQGPGALYEIDSTPADVMLVSLDRETVIGRAHVYFVKDVMSRLIAGAHICTNPSWEEEMVALENASTNKVEYCAKFGIEINEEEWPSQYLPKKIIGDRGEHKSKYSNNLVNINVRVANTPSYRGDLKPYIEQQFRRFNARMRESITDGAVKKEHRERGDKNPENDAIYTIEAFTKLVILFVLEYNNSALPSGFFMTRELFEEKVELTPLAVWNWGMKGSLLHEMSRNLIRYNLLPKEDGLVSRSGIVFKKLCYTSDRAIKEGWFEEESINGQKKIVVNYDPRNCSSVFIKMKDGSFDQCFLTPKFKEYEGLHFNDVKVLINYKEKQLKKMKKQQVNTEAVLDAVAKVLTKSETEKTKAAQKGKPKSAKFKNKRLVRNMDKRMISSQNAWTYVNNHNNDNIPNNIVPFQKHENQPTSKVDQMQLFLMSKNKERRNQREHE